MILGDFGATRPGGPGLPLIGQGPIAANTGRTQWAQTAGSVLDVEGYKTATPEERAESDKNLAASMAYQKKLEDDARRENQRLWEESEAKRMRDLWVKEHGGQARAYVATVQGGSGKSYAIPIIGGAAVLALLAWKFL